MKKMILVLMLVLVGTGFGQEIQEMESKMQVSASNFSVNFVTFGLSSNVEYPLYHLEKHKKTLIRRKPVVKNSQIFTMGNVGYYRKEQDKNCFFLETGLGERKFRKNDWHTEFMLGLGYLRTFNEGHTYEVSDAGKVSRTKLAGSNYLIPSLSCGFGKKIENMPRPIHFHVRLKTFLMYPHYHHMLPQFALETGVRFDINKVVKHKKIIKK